MSQQTWQRRQDVLTRASTATLETGHWYAAAIDTGPIPASLALDTIEERLKQELKIGSLKLYSSREDVPTNVPATVRDAAGADVWATGQYLGPSGSSTLPDQVLIVAEMQSTAPVPSPPRPTGPPAPPGPRPRPTPTPTPTPTQKPAMSTSTLVAIGLGSIVLVGGGIALLWYSSRPKKNPRRRRRRR